MHSLFLILCERILEDEDLQVRRALLRLLLRFSQMKKPSAFKSMELKSPEVEKSLPQVLSGIGKKVIKAKHVLFAVLSFLGANDVDVVVRTEAIKFLGELKDVESSLIAQACRKDTINQFTRAPPFKMSLLACGVFAHGIEEQFMQIRMQSLLSLFALAKGEESTVLCVFIDALLDECDWIRLAALKFIKQLLNAGNGIELTLQDGLEALLAALDDLNEAIRKESLLVVASIRLVSSEITDAFIRSQRCLQALSSKYPEMESQIVECAFNLASKNLEKIKTTPELISHLLGSQDCRYFIPSNNYSNFSNVQQAILVALLSDSPSEAKRLALNLLERFEVPALASIYLQKEVAMVGDWPRLSMLVSRSTDVELRYDTDLVPQPQFYFGKHKAYFRPKRVTCTPSNGESIPFGQLRAVYVEIEDGELIGDKKDVDMNVKLWVNFKETGSFNIAPNGRIKIPIIANTNSFEVVLCNGDNRLEMWPPFKFILNKT